MKISEPGVEEVVDWLRDQLGNALLEAKVTGRRRVFVRVDREHFKASLIALKELGVDFLEALTGTDEGNGIEVIAHVGRSVSIAIKTTVPKEDPRLPSLVDLYPGAEIYEREIWEMLGVVFEGNPRLARTFLPEEWPKGVYPLRKDYEPKHPEPLR
jgi:NADH:ubiquinone oxidoreductase subunit C